MELLKNMKWRYATKAYDATKKVSDSDLAKIKEAIQLAATSFGLQLFKVLVVENPDTRAELRKASWDQSPVTDASHLLVFCNYATAEDKHVDEYISLKAKVQGLNEADLKPYGDFMKGFIQPIPAEGQAIWTSKQTYIALANLLAACAELKIDSTPMEGFDAAVYDKLLGLSEKGLQASVVAPIGYRSTEDQTQHAPKIRKSIEDLFEVV